MEQNKANHTDNFILRQKSPLCTIKKKKEIK